MGIVLCNPWGVHLHFGDMWWCGDSALALVLSKLEKALKPNQNMAESPHQHIGLGFATHVVCIRTLGNLCWNDDCALTLGMLLSKWGLCFATHGVCTCTLGNICAGMMIVM